MTRRFMIIATVLACMIGQAAARKVGETPYRFFFPGHFVVGVYINEEGPFPFILDTGSNRTVVFESLRVHLDIEPVPEPARMVRSFSKTEPRPVFTVGSLEVAGQVLRDVKILSLDDWDEMSWRPAGILGLDVLARYHLLIQASKRRIVLFDKDLSPPRRYRQRERIKLRKDDSGLLFAPLVIDGVKAEGLIDTGASRTYANWPLGEGLGIDQTAPGLQRDDAMLGALADIEPEVFRFTADSFKMGTLKWDSARLLISDIPIFDDIGLGETPIAIVGSDLLFALDTFIDFDKGQMLIRLPYLRELINSEVLAPEEAEKP